MKTGIGLVVREEDACSLCRPPLIVPCPVRGLLSSVHPWHLQPCRRRQLHCLPRWQQLVGGRVDVPVQQGLRAERKRRLADVHRLRRRNLQPGRRPVHQYVAPRC